MPDLRRCTDRQERQRGIEEGAKGFSDADEVVVPAFAAWGPLQIQRARLPEQNLQRDRELGGLVHARRALTSFFLELNEILRAVVYQMPAICGTIEAPIGSGSGMGS